MGFRPDWCESLPVLRRVTRRGPLALVSAWWRTSHSPFWAVVWGGDACFEAILHNRNCSHDSERNPGLAKAECVASRHSMTLVAQTRVSATTRVHGCRCSRRGQLDPVVMLTESLDKAMPPIDRRCGYGPIAV